MNIFVLILLSFIPIAVADGSVNVREADLYKAPDSSNLENDLFKELSIKAELYNQFDKTPLILQRLVGSEQIAVRIKLENGEMLHATLLMTGGKVRDFYRYDTPEDPRSKFEPSIIVETDEQTVGKILHSDEPLREAVKGMNENSLKVKAKGFFRNAELWTLQQLYS